MKNLENLWMRFNVNFKYKFIERYKVMYFGDHKKMLSFQNIKQFFF